jgi:hypothetical protein
MEAQNELSVPDVTSLIQQAQNSHSDPVSTALSIFGSLSSNISLTGDVLNQALQQAGIQLKGVAATVISQISSISKSGDAVTITNNSKYSAEQGGKTIDVDKLVSFRVGQQNQLPEISNINGLKAHVGIKANVEQIRVAVKNNQKVLEITGSALGFRKTIDIPLR